VPNNFFLVYWVIKKSTAFTQMSVFQESIILIVFFYSPPPSPRHRRLQGQLVVTIATSGLYPPTERTKRPRAQGPSLASSQNTGTPQKPGFFSFFGFLAVKIVSQVRQSPSLRCGNDKKAYLMK